MQRRLRCAGVHIVGARWAAHLNGNAAMAMRGRDNVYSRVIVLFQRSYLSLFCGPCIVLCTKGLGVGLGRVLSAVAWGVLGPRRPFTIWSSPDADEILWL